MTTVLVFIATMLFLIVVASTVAYRHDGRIINRPWFTWIFAHLEEALFTIPAMIAAVRGRRLLS